MTRFVDRRSTVWLILFVLIAAPLILAAALHGRFLITAAKAAPVDTWGGVAGGGNPVEVTNAVRDVAKEIDAGEIRWTYDTYVGPTGGPLTRGGAVVAGGFFMNEKVKVKEGFKLAWVQTVIDNTTTGANSWNLPAANAGEFPDATPAAKRYPFESIPAPSPPAANPTLAFQDIPSRALGVNQSWLAELGLVCIRDNPDGNGVREVRVIGTYLWGFRILARPPAGAGIEDVTPSVPRLWGPATPQYLDTLNDFYDGLGGGGGPASRCTAPAASAGMPCGANANCDDPAGSGNGVCTPGGPVASSKFSFANDTNCFEKIVTCGDANCQPLNGEDPCNCPQDCPGACPTCGDGFCQTGEGACTCPEDCEGSCPGCGDAFCDEGQGEDACSCPADCSPLLTPDCPFCGDGECTGDENPVDCPTDCAHCNDDDPCTDDGFDPKLGCTHTPNATSCTDEDPTTCADSCSATGGCEGTFVPEPIEIDDSLRMSKGTAGAVVFWLDNPGPYNVYRGLWLETWEYTHLCYGDTSGQSAPDATIPAPGTYYYYLVSRADACRESVVGRDSTLAPIPNPLPCPGPEPPFSLSGAVGGPTDGPVFPAAECRQGGFARGAER